VGRDLVGVGAGTALSKNITIKWEMHVRTAHNSILINMDTLK
jgi:hypothetical protein